MGNEPKITYKNTSKDLKNIMRDGETTGWVIERVGKSWEIFTPDGESCGTWPTVRQAIGNSGPGING